MANETILTVDEPTQLLPFLIAKFPGKGRNKVKALLTHRQIVIDNHVVTRHDHLLHKGQQVIVHGSTHPRNEPIQSIKVLYEDKDLLVINKPAGLLSIATDEEREKTAYRMMMDHVASENPKARVFIVHRLDKETSGVMMLAKNAEIQQALQNTWKETVLERAYIAVVEGTVLPANGMISTWLKESKTKTMYVSKPGDGLKAITHYKTLEAGGGYSLLEIHLDTGRKNQIRVHMQSIGHSVVGDKRYGSSKDPMGRLGLHARVLSFSHPATKQVMRFETDIPASFRRLFAKV